MPPLRKQLLPETDKEYVAGLQKGLSVIEAFAVERAPLTVARAAELAGISRASARRCLRTLQALGYAEHDGKLFQLAPRALRLGYAYLASTHLARIVQPVIEIACERTRHSISVALLDDTRVLVIARAYVQRSLSVGLGVGSWLPAYCSANGRVLLAALPDNQIEALLKRTARVKLTKRTLVRVPEIVAEIARVRERGYAINDEEVEPGLSTIAIPVRSRSGVAVASLSLSSIGTSAERKQLAKLLPELQATSFRLSGML
ncbi:MAG TPA: IclR family transcriptional regulator C-terminal domain-containing protein [Pseudolabrys sp.]|jgi:IclR family pca regulon transcriptional regulator|nr:IclR family transcriptional regulator C-terminal domain-containing protein [Pseudolabrys sp.]